MRGNKNFEMGVKANYAGIPKNKNPFGPYLDAGKSWDEGWDFAEKLKSVKDPLGLFKKSTAYQNGRAKALARFEK